MNKRFTIKYKICPTGPQVKNSLAATTKGQIFVHTDLETPSHAL